MIKNTSTFKTTSYLKESHKPWKHGKNVLTSKTKAGHIDGAWHVNRFLMELRGDNA